MMSCSLKIFVPKSVRGFVLVMLLINFLVAANGQGKPDTSRPNILFVMADDHTGQSWGIYGGILEKYVQNTNIKRLASRGAVLDNCFDVNSLCTPSRATILTGQYSNNNGVYALNDALDPDHENIAKELQKAGYQTAIFGKWGLKKRPAGFDHFMVMHDQGIYFNPVFKSEENWKDDDQGPAGKKYKGYNTDLVTDFALDWLKDIDPGKPFFAMVHFKGTHEPWEYPDRLKNLYKEVDIPYPQSLFDFGRQTTGRVFSGQPLSDLAGRWMKYQKDPTHFWTTYPGMPFSLEGLDSVQARIKTYEKFIKDYLRCGAANDENLGRLLDYLDQKGLSKNTIIIYTSDQGYFLGEHGFFDKRVMMEEALHMPFVIVYPKEITGGTRLEDFILNTDFAALFADYAHIKKPSFIQGRSFRENLKGHTAPDWRTSMYYRYWEHAPKYPGHFGIRTKKYKLVFYYGQPLGINGASKKTTTPGWEFYNLDMDPHELHNAYHDPQYQKIIKALKQQLLQQKHLAGDDSDKDSPVMQEIFSKYW